MRSLTPARRRALGHVFLALGLLLQAWLLYQPVEGESSLPQHADKVAHALMFGVPAALALWLGHRWAPLALAWYAPVSELIQGTDLVGRDPDIHDVVADITGIILLSALIVARKRRSVR